MAIGDKTINMANRSLCSPRCVGKSCIVLMVVGSFLSCCSIAAGQNLNAGSIDFAAYAEQDLTITDADALGVSPGVSNGTVLSNQGAIGRVIMEWAGDFDGDGEVALTNFEAEFVGTLPVFGQYTLRSGGPSGITATGLLTSINQSGGDLISAFWSIDTAFSFEFDSGVTIYTQKAATFEGTFGPDLSGTGFISSEAIEGYLLNATVDQDDDLSVAESLNRSVSAVPEPTGMLVLVGFLGLSCVRRKKRS